MLHYLQSLIKKCFSVAINRGKSLKHNFLLKAGCFYAQRNRVSVLQRNGLMKPVLKIFFFHFWFLRRWHTGIPNFFIMCPAFFNIITKPCPIAAGLAIKRLVSYKP